MRNQNHRNQSIHPQTNFHSVLATMVLHSIVLGMAGCGGEADDSQKSSSQMNCEANELLQEFCDGDEACLASACDVENRCGPEGCENQICPPGALTCDDDRVRLCNQAGQGYIEGMAIDCSARGQACRAGKCIDSVAESRGTTCETIDCLAGRTEALVCGRYREDILADSPTPFTPGMDTCDPGSLTDAAYGEALGAVNYGRWLTGLPEVNYDAALHPATQACATMMANERALSHSPHNNWACYSQDGAEAAATSNIHLNSGQESVVESVIGFFRDGGENNSRDVGHRRWLQSPTLGAVGFGYHQSLETGATGSCYYVQSDSELSRVGPPFIAYPNAGPFPIGLLTSRFGALPWSVSVSTKYRDPWPSDGQWTVSVTRVNGAERTELEVSKISASEGWYGQTKSLVFTPNFAVTTGTYQVKVSSSDHEFVWETKVVQCGPSMSTWPSN